ncbi:GTA-gp10 family protein [Pacificimonas sp. ICDLI1SI03]
MAANHLRGEVALEVAGQDVILRPTFAALCAAEEELGSLFALVERAAAGALTLAEMAGLFWHVSHGFDGDRDTFSDGVLSGGLVRATPALKALLTEILAGR